jgi:PE-PPE domain
MRRARRRWRLSAGMAIAVTSLIAVPVATPMPHVQVRDVRLTSGDGADSPLGDGTALVIGGSGIPIPPERYVDAANTLYLQPREFTGTPQALDTPEGFYPTTGVNSLTADASEAQGAQIMDGAITGQIADGNVDAANPVVVFGYSQSSAMSTFTMQQLQDQGVPSDDVHFVLVGDTAAPNGGLLERFDLPGNDLSVPSFGVTFGNPTPADLYPTDIYTLEYDGFADFPQYPIDPLSDLKAFAGMIYEHLTYLDLDPGQIANAIPLETLQAAGDSLTDYYMIPVGDLPLLDPLRLIPFVGNPLADPLQPDMTVLVN